MPKTIPGLKLIRHNADNVDLPDDPSFPFKLEAEFRPPEFMQVAFVMQYGGSEEIIVRAMSMKALNAFIKANDIRKHCRLRRFTITGPDGTIEQFPKP